MAKWIKNDSGGSKTWQGQVFTDQEYYEIEVNEAIAWANNSLLLTDIGSGDAVVAKDDSGSNDITDVNSAINYLKDNQPIKIDKTTPIRQHPMSESTELRARLVGSHFTTVTKGTDKDSDWKVPAVAYGGSNKQCVMNGIQYYAKDAEVGDHITFQVVDVDNIIGYGAGVVLDEFSKEFYVMPDSAQMFVLYKANLIKDLYIRVKYHSTGATNDVKFVCNIFRHIDTSITI